jgi:hypothetical protein
MNSNESTPANVEYLRRCEVCDETFVASRSGALSCTRKSCRALAAEFTCFYVLESILSAALWAGGKSQKTIAKGVFQRTAVIRPCGRCLKLGLRDGKPEVKPPLTDHEVKEPGEGGPGVGDELEFVLHCGFDVGMRMKEIGSVLCGVFLFLQTRMTKRRVSVLEGNKPPRSEPSFVVVIMAFHATGFF